MRATACPWPTHDDGSPAADRRTATHLVNRRIGDLSPSVLAAAGVLARTVDGHSLVSPRLGRAWLREAVASVVASSCDGVHHVEVDGRRLILAVTDSDDADLAYDLVESLRLAGVCTAPTRRISAVA